MVQFHGAFRNTLIGTDNAMYVRCYTENFSDFVFSYVLFDPTAIEFPLYYAISTVDH